MAPQLPWELEENILSRLPPQSLIRFRKVCKKWNSLFTDKSFLNNHLSLSRPQFILVTSFKINSIDIINHDINSIDSTIELHELPSSDIPNRDMYTTIPTCDELLFFNYRFWGNGTALWNPWLRQVKWIELEKDEPFNVFGFGYDNSRPEKVYKILGQFVCFGQLQGDIVVYECASHTFKCIIDTPEEDWFLTETAKQPTVSLNGNLYWITRNLETGEM